METETFEVKYLFEFENGEKRQFSIEIEEDNLELVNNPPKVEWAKMEHFRCPNCPLENKEYCPLALQLPGIIKFFSNLYSYEKAKIYVYTKERNYFKETSVQRGLSSLLGVLMPVSGCPVMAKLKPMVPFHLPFASHVETEYRVFSTYMLAQFLRYKKGFKPDWEMKNLAKIYEEIRNVNLNIVNKLKELVEKDASLNAVVILDTFTNFISFELEDMEFGDVINYFGEFLKE
jgi:hypothetical protein